VQGAERRAEIDKHRSETARKGGRLGERPAPAKGKLTDRRQEMTTTEKILAKIAARFVGESKAIPAGRRACGLCPARNVSCSGQAYFCSSCPFMDAEEGCLGQIGKACEGDMHKCAKNLLKYAREQARSKREAV
jgi:hypothetical protein